MDLILWKRLFRNDYRAIHGQAAPSGTGGGAMHIALGTNKPQNDVKSFLGVQEPVDKTVETEPWPGHHEAGKLSFGVNPARQNEWRIADQFNHRHPGWTPAAGFPAAFDPNDRPVTLVARVSGKYHVRFLTQKQFAKISPALAKRDRGVAPAPIALLQALSIPPTSAVVEFEQLAPNVSAELSFDPSNVEDARRRVVASILRRRGQPAFRKSVLETYSNTCAISGCVDAWVLEAAHISPYRGPETNHITNGLLLRADLHTLFDLALISINPATMKICVSAKLKDPAYAGFNGKPLAEGKTKPSAAALAEHFSRFEP